MRRGPLVAALRHQRARAAPSLPRVALPRAAAAHQADQPRAGRQLRRRRRAPRARTDRRCASWPGMVGHNWGSEHAERWIWLHGVGFAGSGSGKGAGSGSSAAWLDVALGRLKLAGRMTPWVANGVLSIDGRRHRIGGVTARGTRVHESTERCELQLPGQQGLSVHALIDVPSQAAAGWRYADPDGGRARRRQLLRLLARADRHRRPTARPHGRCTASMAACTSSACASATTACRSRRSQTAERRSPRFRSRNATRPARKRDWAGEGGRPSRVEVSEQLPNGRSPEGGEKRQVRRIARSAPAEPAGIDHPER